MNQFILSRWKIIVVMLSLIVIPLLIVNLPKSTKTPDKPSSSSTTNVKPLDVKTIGYDAKNLHWSSPTTLTFTFFDDTVKQKTLVETDGVKQKVLVRDANIKISEIYWSNNNTALIFDYGVPYKTYLFSNANVLSTLPIQGYAFSWSPKEDIFFYIDTTNDITPQPSFYSLTTAKSQPLNIPLPSPIDMSFWSPTGSTILLYGIDSETGVGSAWLLTISNNQVAPIKQKGISPAWSSDGQRFSLITEKGISVFDTLQNETLAYQSPTARQSVSYTWIDAENILAYDSNTTLFSLISVKTNLSRGVLSSLHLKKGEKAQIAVSSDKKSVAVSSLSTGLLIFNVSSL